MLEPCLLALLKREEAYGYRLAEQLEEEGIGPVPGGSLYPALLRLEKQALVTSEWRAGEGGPGRKYYQLTPKGSAMLGTYESSWRHFSQSINRLLGEHLAV